MIKLNLARVLKAAQSDQFAGWCTKCGAKAYGVDPDARKDECQKCQAKAVYGAEELVLMLV